MEQGVGCKFWLSVHGVGLKLYTRFDTVDGRLGKLHQVRAFIANRRLESDDASIGDILSIQTYPVMFVRTGPLDARPDAGEAALADRIIRLGRITAVVIEVQVEIEVAVEGSGCSSTIIWLQLKRWCPRHQALRHC